MRIRAQILTLLLIMTVGLLAQERVLPLTGKAAKQYQEKNYSEARILIEQSLDEAGQEDPYTWHVRGYIYKELLKEEKNYSKESELRKEALKSFERCMELDTESKYLEWNRTSLRFIASTYWNGAVMQMEQRNRAELGRAQDFFEEYCRILESSGQGQDIDDFKVDFYRAYATANRKIIEELRRNGAEYDDYKTEMERIEESYQKALKIRPNDYGANYNYSINLYNEAAYRIENIPPEADLTRVILDQEGCIAIFERALPYAVNAENLRPGRIEILKALRAIYLSLNNYDKFDHYNELIREKQGELLIPAKVKEGGGLNRELFRGTERWED